MRLKRPRRYQHTKRLSLEFLEDKRLLTCNSAGPSVPAGVIDESIISSQHWDDTSAPYVISGDIDVNSFSTLTIAPGVTILAAEETSVLDIASDGSQSCLIADGSIFNAPVNFRSLAFANVSNSVINSRWVADPSNPTFFDLNNNQFNASPVVQATYVPFLDGNTFAPGTAVGIQGDITRDTTWSADISAEYVLDETVEVLRFQTLEIGQGVTVSSNQASLIVEAAGELLADEVDFLVELQLEDGSRGSVTGSVFERTLEDSSNTVEFTISGNTFQFAPRLLATNIETLTDNILASEMVIGVIPTNIRSSIEWPALENVLGYDLQGDISILANGNLQISPDTTIFGSVFDELRVSDGAELVATDVEFFASVVVSPFGHAQLDESTLHGNVSLDVESQDDVSITNAMLLGSLSVSPEFIPFLTEATVSASTIAVLDGRISNDVEWPAIQGVRSYNLLRSVFVENSGSLTLAPGVSIEGNQSFFSNGLIVLGRVNFEGNDLDSRVTFGSSSHGSVTGTTFRAETEVLSNEDLVLSGNRFTEAPEVAYDQLERIVENTFDIPSIRLVGRTGTAPDVLWPAIENVEHLQIPSLTFDAATSLTIASGYSIGLSGGTLRFDAGSTVNADGVRFSTQVDFRAGAGVNIVNSEFLDLTTLGSDGVIAFENNVFRDEIRVAAELVPLLRSNQLFVPEIVVIGDINRDVTWHHVVGIPYRLLGTTDVESVATLTIESGVAVTGDVILNVGSFSRNGLLIADNVLFDVRLVVTDNGAVDISNSTFVSSPTFGDTELNYQLSNNSFQEGAIVSPEFFAELGSEGNSFAVGSTIGVTGDCSITSDVEWPQIPGVENIELLRSCNVEDTGSLTIADGYSIGGNRLAIDTNGALFANHVEFSNEIRFNGGYGQITNSQFIGEPLFFGSLSDPWILQGNHFESFDQLEANLLPLLADNTFATNSIVEVRSNINADLVWPFLENVEYQLTSDVEVTGSSTLTISPGVRLFQNSTNVDLIINSGSTIEATGVTFDVRLDIGRTTFGNLDSNVFGLPRLLIEGSTFAVFTNNDFSETTVGTTGGSSQTIDLTNNYWGTTDLDEVEAKITHQVDSSFLPLVIFDPVLPNPPGTAAADSNGDGQLDTADLDLLTAAIAASQFSADLDYNGDGVLTNADIDVWLATAGLQNLPDGRSYQRGDANLDGFVDVSDFNAWNSNKFTNSSLWSDGNFNADGVVDVGDFNIWNDNKFDDGSARTAAPIPNQNSPKRLFGADDADENEQLTVVDRVFQSISIQ